MVALLAQRLHVGGIVPAQIPIVRHDGNLHARCGGRYALMPGVRGRVVRVLFAPQPPPPPPPKEEMSAQRTRCWGNNARLMSSAAPASGRTRARGERGSAAAPASGRTKARGEPGPSAMSMAEATHP